LLLSAIPAGRRPFWSQDEARFAVLARDMVEHGRWLVPEIRERPYLNKPQLYIWSIAALSLPGGRVTEHIAAVPSRLSAAATVGAVIAIGRLLWGWPTGLVAGLLLVATPAHFLFGHAVLPDPMLVAWLTWALWAYLAAAEHTWSPRLLATFYGCVAGALLTKGPVALVALLAAALSTVFTDGARTLARLRPLQGAAILGASALPWLVPYYLQAREAFSHGVVQNEYVHWVIDNPAGTGVQDIAVRLRHVALALAGFVPWTLLLLGAALWWRQAPDRGRRRVLVWTITWWLATGLSGNFRTRYFLVVYPVFALLAAEFVATAVPRRGGRLVVVALAATAMIIALFPAALSTIPGLLTGEDSVFLPDTWWERAALSSLGIVGAALTLASLHRRWFLAAAVMLAITVSALLAVEGVTYPRRYAQAYDIRPLTEILRHGDAAHAPVIGHPDLRLSYDFYIDRRVIEVPTADALLGHLSDAAPALVVTSAERWAALAPRAPPGWRIAGIAVVGGRTIVVAANSGT
jgi:4-amino-4-deoxy-L-arabinose transferase-like glycosyltransferase